jgi:hypothetical protein
MAAIKQFHARSLLFKLWRKRSRVIVIQAMEKKVKIMYRDNDMQHSLAASALIKYSPAPVVQQPARKEDSKGPFEDAQQPEPYMPANPTRPLTYQEERVVLINRIK